MMHVFMSENDYKSYAVNARQYLIKFSPLGDQAAEFVHACFKYKRLVCGLIYHAMENEVITEVVCDKDWTGVKYLSVWCCDSHLETMKVKECTSGQTA